jgi:hypothetical protein
MKSASRAYAGNTSSPIAAAYASLMRLRSGSVICFGIAAMGAQKMLSCTLAVTMSRSCGTTLAIATRGSVMPLAMPERICTMAPSAQRGNWRMRARNRS